MNKEVMVEEIKDVYVHESAIIDDDVKIGKKSKIWHFVHVSQDAVIGEGSVLGQNVFIGRGVKIGHGVKIQNNVSVYEGVTVSDHAFLGPSCVFTNVINPRSNIIRRDEFRETRVGVGASIGANATIICGHDLGDYSFVGAGSVVTKDVPPHALVFGNPARRTGWMCRCGERLPLGSRPECKSCHERYAVTDDRCIRVENSHE